MIDFAIHQPYTFGRMAFRRTTDYAYEESLKSERQPMRKIYVDVKEIHTKSGTIRPLAIYWQDEKSGYETEYEIEKILSGPELRFSKAGGTGKRYIVVIQGQRRVLFLEKDRWFIETEK